MAGQLSRLPAWARFYFYGLQGVLDEIVFTAVFDAILDPKGNRQLMGHTSIFTFFIYGGLSFLVEKLFLFMTKRGISIFGRLVVYVMCVYIWEYSCGLVLRQFNACSWDYSHYSYNIHGLVTLEYAPGWLVLCALQDITYKFLLNMKFTLTFTMDKKVS